MLLVMGVVVFLMVEYIGMFYVEIIKYVFLLVAISYIVLFYIVHLGSFWVCLLVSCSSSCCSAFCSSALVLGIISFSWYSVCSVIFVVVWLR